MTICAAAYNVDPKSIYPVLDPRRTPGPGPWNYGYLLAWDAITITVTRNQTPSAAMMRVNFVSSLREFKEIQAWNLFSNTVPTSIGSSGLGLGTGTSMTITQAGSGGTSCGSGAHTVVLCRHFAWPRGRTALYTFDPQDFWDFWGGCTVTFNWFSDNAAGGKWGNQTPAPIYPLVRFPDRTVTTDGALFRVIFGGTDFTGADSAYLAAQGLSTAGAIPLQTLPRTPVDGTLLRDANDPKVYVIYGGAKFWIPDPATLFAMGFSWGDVKVVPPMGTSRLGAMPIDGTLIKERNDPKVFIADGGKLRWITSPTVFDRMCLAWRHIRTVPDGGLTPLPHGSDLV